MVKITKKNALKLIPKLSMLDFLEIAEKDRKVRRNLASIAVIKATLELEKLNAK